MSSADIQAIAAAVQASAAVITLPYIALQVRRAKKDAEHQSRLVNQQAQQHSEQLAHQTAAIQVQARAAEIAIYQGFTEVMIDIDQCFVHSPDLRPCFYAGKDLATDDPSYDKATAIAEMFRDFEYHIARHQGFLADDIFTGWARYFDFIRSNSPIFARFSADSASWFVQVGESSVESN
jgi:hypothetical protein